MLQETWFPLADRHQSQVTHTLQQTREILCRYGLEPQRRLGQNFVVDPNTVRRIAKLSGASSATTIVEIGGGLGALTLALAQTGAQVTTIECDKRLVAALREIVAAANVTVVEGDATSLDWQQLLKGQGDVQLVANLPYNIASTYNDLLKRSHIYLYVGDGATGGRGAPRGLSRQQSGGDSFFASCVSRIGENRWTRAGYGFFSSTQR